MIQGSDAIIQSIRLGDCCSMRRPFILHHEHLIVVLFR